MLKSFKNHCCHMTLLKRKVRLHRQTKGLEKNTCCKEEGTRSFHLKDLSMLKGQKHLMRHQEVPSIGK